MKKKSIAIYSFGILLSLSLAGGIWFFGSKLIPETPKIESVAEVNDEVIPLSGDGSQDPPISDDVNDSTNVDQPKPVYTVNLKIIDGPQFSDLYRNYGVTAKASYEGCEAPSFEYLIYDNQNNLIKTETRSRFALNATESGRYYLVARETTTGEESDPVEITGCKVRKMTKERVEQICNSGNYSTQAKEEAYAYNPDLVLKFNSSSENAYSISEICNTIDMGIWQKVTVSDIKYDNLGRIKEIKFNVVM